MDGILDHDLPRGPSTKAGQRAANASLLQTRRQEERERVRRLQLIEAIKRAEEDIADERAAKHQVLLQSRALREEMERLALLAGDLQKEKARQEKHVLVRESHAEKRREPLTKKFNDGMLTFQRIGCEKYPPERTGPSSGRTGFVFDYTGRIYLSGNGERKSETQMQKAAQKEVERRRSEQRRLLEEQQRVALGEGGDHHNLTSSSSLPAIGGNSSFNGTNNSVASKRGAGPSHPHKNTVYGKPSHVDLEKYKHLSSKRSRYYTDYEGRRIAMDPNDWPQTDGLLLL